MFAPEIIRKSSARYKHGQLLDFSIEWTCIGRLISWKNVSNLGFEWPKHHEGHRGCCPPEEAFPVIMHLFGLAQRHAKKSILKHAENNAKNSRKKYLKRINNPNPFFYSKRRERHLASKTWNLLQKLSGPKSNLNLLLFWPPASKVSTSSTVWLRCMEMN